jgi:hypothetical protein
MSLPLIRENRVAEWKLRFRPAHPGGKARVIHWPGNSQIEFFLAIFIVGLLPAVINGFPFYEPDSHAYSGQVTGYDYRSAVPGYIASLIYPFLGFWSLPVINASVFALLFTRLRQLFAPRLAVPTAAFAVMASSAAFYLSEVMPDIWIVFLFMAIALLQFRWSSIDFAIAGLSAAGHGSHPYILAIACGLLFPFFPRAIPRLAIITIATVVFSILANAVVSYVKYGESFPPRLGWAVVASKAMNDTPEAFQEFCQAQAQEKICALKYRLDPIEPHGSDDRYLWHSGIFQSGLRNRSDGMTLRELNTLGRKLAAFVALHHPLEYLRESLVDYRHFFSANRCVGFWGAVPRETRFTYLSSIHDIEPETLARKDLLSSAGFCRTIFLANMIVISLALAALLSTWRALPYAKRLMVGLFLGAIIANDSLFALASGGFARYHLRALFLIALVWLVAREHSDSSPSPGQGAV